MLKTPDRAKQIDQRRDRKGALCRWGASSRALPNGRASERAVLHFCAEPARLASVPRGSEARLKTAVAPNKLIRGATLRERSAALTPPAEGSLTVAARPASAGVCVGIFARISHDGKERGERDAEVKHCGPARAAAASEARP